jgi:hypothetical protein
MTVNNQNGVADSTYCYGCHRDFTAPGKEIKAKCGHVYHHTSKCWEGQCSVYECQRKLKEKQYSQENWAVVKGTVAICAVAYALNWVASARK